MDYVKIIIIKKELMTPETVSLYLSVKVKKKHYIGTNYNPVILFSVLNNLRLNVFKLNWP